MQPRRLPADLVDPHSSLLAFLPPRSYLTPLHRSLDDAAHSSTTSMRLSRNSSIRLPDSPDRSALLGVAHQQKGSRMRIRPQSLTTAALFALCFLAGFLAHRAPAPRTVLAYAPTSLLPDHLSSSFSSSRTILSTATSCRLCDNDPSNPLCEYGDSAIRLSRAYEGSGVRVRKVLEKALRGEEIRFGVIGASVTAGHGLDHGGKVAGPAWPYRFIDEFKKTFPNSRIIDGSAPAMTSRFYSFCWKTMVPETEADIWLIELDVNNEQSQETLDADDALMRSLLDQPNEPAVIRLSVLALSFGDMGRGLASNLLLSQFFDTPIITCVQAASLLPLATNEEVETDASIACSVKNFLLPYLIQRPDLASDYFTNFPDGKPDLVRSAFSLVCAAAGLTLLSLAAAHQHPPSQRPRRLPHPLPPRADVHYAAGDEARQAIG